MNRENEHTEGHPNREIANDLSDCLRTFVLAQMPGEIVVRYRAPLPIDTSLPSVWRSSKNRWWVFGLGGLWLSTGVATPIIVVFPMLLGLYSFALLGIGPTNLNVFPIGIFCYPVLLMLLMLWPFTYFYFLLLGSTSIRNPNWLEALMGPTHICLTSSGIKLSWQLSGISFYGPMVSWNDLSEVEGNADELENSELTFKFDRNGAAAQFVIDPNGFLNPSEKEMFLRTIENYVPKPALYPDARACIARARASEPIVVSDNPDQAAEQQSQQFIQLLADYSSSAGSPGGDNPVLAIEDKAQDQREAIQQSIKLKKSSKQSSAN